ncbi:hypothetical protein ACPCC3_29770 [Streptomyces cellulosae]|uniref:hypothetical protein n=1 Tax=unclassified Streptomyces TaxID=2593676 RepID=UPI0019688F4E
MRHRPARSDRLPPRRLAGHVGGRLLLGQRLQILLQADHPAPVHLLGVRQSRPHPFQLGFEFPHLRGRGLLPRFQNRL